MKKYLPRFYSWDRYGVVLVWPWLFKTMARDGRQPRGAACGPVILLRHEDQAAPWLFNHERIHVVQALELGIVGFWLLCYGQTFYYRYCKGMSRKEAYLWNHAEQEAYRNQHNLNYLKTRPQWAQFKYLRDKRKLTYTDVPGEVRFLDGGA